MKDFTVPAFTSMPRLACCDSESHDGGKDKGGSEISENKQDIYIVTGVDCARSLCLLLTLIYIV
jgi:hypothetical protein